MLRIARALEALVMLQLADQSATDDADVWRIRAQELADAIWCSVYDRDERIRGF